MGAVEKLFKNNPSFYKDDLLKIIRIISNEIGKDSFWNVENAGEAVKRIIK